MERDATAAITTARSLKVQFMADMALAPWGLGESSASSPKNDTQYKPGQRFRRFFREVLDTQVSTARMVQSCGSPAREVITQKAT
jgi:hypothetical protein